MKFCFYEVKDYEEAFIRAFAAQYGVEVAGVYPQALTHDNVRFTKDCDVVSVLGFSRADGEIMQALRTNGVRYFSTRTVGFEHVDVRAAEANGLVVLHANYDSSNVADFAVMLMLMLIRKCKVTVCRGLVNNFSLDEIMGKDLKDMTVGVIGTGKIGTRVMKTLSGFGCRILCNDKYPSAAAAAWGEYVPLERLYAESDIVTLHTPLTEENFHLIDEKAISLMKKGVYIVNTARGALIDTVALIHGIESEKIGGAGLDTIEGEEGICHVDIKARISNKQNIFYIKQFPNVIYTPHIGFYTEEAVGQMVESAFAGVALAEAGRENKYLVRGLK